VDHQRAAELQVVLEGVPLPASRDALIGYARAQDPAAAGELERLPEGEYDRLDAVGDALVHAPRPPGPPPRQPRAESGRPPGGGDYVQPFPVSGSVRPSAPRGNPPQQTIEQQTQLQNEQKQRQEG
jgi:hypothetical protein